MVVLDREQKVATGLEDYLRQGPLCKQGVGREDPDERVVFQQLLQPRLEGLGFGRFAFGHGELSEAKAQVVREDVEHVDGIAIGVAALFAGLAIDRDDAVVRDAGHRGEPDRKGLAELFEREFGDHATDRGGVRRLPPGEAQRSREGPPMVASPTPQAGEIGLTAEKSDEREAQNRMEAVTNAARFSGIIDPAKRIYKGDNGIGHP